MIWRTLGNAMVRRAVTTGLDGIQVVGRLPTEPSIIVCNHTAWWDGPVMLSVLPGCAMMMGAEGLQRFPFAAWAGVIGVDPRSPRKGLRSALEALENGRHVVIFPEGEHRHPNRPGTYARGASWLASKAGTPLIPTGLRYLWGEYPVPRAVVGFGDALPVGSSMDEVERGVEGQLEAILDAPGTAIVRSYQRVDWPTRALSWATGWFWG